MKRHPQSDIIWEQVRNPQCTGCSLHKEAQCVCLLGDGPVPAEGMIIGEAPGYREDDIQIPFSGKSGVFLRRMLKEIGLDPRTLYITNTVACRPPGNRTPTTKEIKTCSPLYLLKQIEMVKPKAILLLGNTALQFAVGRKASVTKLEGTTILLDNCAQLIPSIPLGIKGVPSRHPSSVIRNEGEKEYPYIVQQFKENLLLFKRTICPVDDGFRFERKLLPFIPKKSVYCDIETNGLNPFKPDSKIHCAGFAQHTVGVCAVPVTDKTPVKKILETHPIIAHRATFEGTWFRQKYGITPRIFADTKLIAYLMNENEPSGLKYQAIRHLGVEPWSEEQDWQNPDLETLLPYNARDNRYGLRLYRERQLPWLKRNPKVQRLLRYILLPATEVLIEMICNGFHIDEKSAKKKLIHCEKEKKRLNDELNKIAGKEVNPGSPKQMSQLFYSQLRLICPVKTAKGADSTSEASLVRLLGQHKAVNILWDWRGWDKKRSTYLEPWIRQGPILHAGYDNTGTDTGRLSSSMVKDKRGEKKTGGVIHQCPRDGFIRNLITPRNPDWCIVAADLSQIELRLVAHAANESTMIKIFNCDPHTPDGDIHLATVMDVLHKTQSEIDKETRKKGKAVNFGFVYGMMPPKFKAYAKEKFELDLSDKECKDYRKGYFRKYPGLLAWHRRVEQFVKTNGWIDSIFGRRRHLPTAKNASFEECSDCVQRGEVREDCFLCGGTNSVQVEGASDEWMQREAVRQAINSPIQSAASDLLLFIIALICSYSLDWDFKIDRSKVLSVGSAHDSMLFECHKKYAKTLRDGIQWTVANLPLAKYFNLELRVPIWMDVACYEDCWEGKEMTL